MSDPFFTLAVTKEAWNKAITDSARMDWLEKNYALPVGCERFSFHSPRPEWHETLKKKYPNGYWSRNFGPKDDSNRWSTLSEAIDHEMSKT